MPIAAPNNVIKTLSAPTTVQKSHPELDLERLKNLLRIEARKYGFERSASFFLRVLYKQYRGHAQFVPMLDLVRKFLRQGYETEGFDLETAAAKARELIASEEPRQLIRTPRTFNRLTAERIHGLIASNVQKNVASGEDHGSAAERAILWVAGVAVRKSMADYQYTSEEKEKFLAILKEALIGALVVQGQKLAEAQQDASQKISFFLQPSSTEMKKTNQQPPPLAILPRPGRMGIMEPTPRPAPPRPAQKVEIKFSPKPEGGRTPEEIAQFQKELAMRLQQKAAAKAAAEAQAEAKRQAATATRAAEEAKRQQEKAAKAAAQEKATKGRNKAKGRRDDQ